jgi:hypothetical protein
VKLIGRYDRRVTAGPPLWTDDWPAPPAGGFGRTLKIVMGVIGALLVTAVVVFGIAVIAA